MKIEDCIQQGQRRRADTSARRNSLNMNAHREFGKGIIQCGQTVGTKQELCGATRENLESHAETWALF